MFNVDKNVCLAPIKSLDWDVLRLVNLQDGMQKFEYTFDQPDVEQKRRGHSKRDRKLRKV